MYTAVLSYQIHHDLYMRKWEFIHMHFGDYLHVYIHAVVPLTYVKSIIYLKDIFSCSLATSTVQMEH